MSSLMRVRSGVIESSFCKMECAASSPSIVSQGKVQGKDKERLTWNVGGQKMCSINWTALPHTAQRFSPSDVMPNPGSCRLPALWQQPELFLAGLIRLDPAPA